MEAARAHKIRLDPTPAQEQALRQAAGNARFAYNWLNERRQAEMRLYDAGERETKPRPSEGVKELNRVKAEEFPFLMLFPVVVEGAGKNYEQACKNWWDPKLKARAPTWKTRRSPRKFVAACRAREIQVEGKRVHLRSFGWIRMREELRFEGVPKRAFISERAGRWFISISVTGEVDSTHYAAGESQAVGGVDAGVGNHIAVLSDGTKYENPRAYRNRLRRLRRAQRKVSRRARKDAKGRLVKEQSANYAKAKKRLANEHYRAVCVRDDAIHNAATDIVRKCDVIVIETLNVEGMRRNRSLAMSVSDAAPAELLRQIRYKTIWAGKQVIEADQWFASSQTCSACGEKNPEVKNLKVRKWTCPACGDVHDRDVNAALNLRAYAAETLPRCTREVTPTESIVNLWANAFGVALDEVGSPRKGRSKRS